AFILPLLACGIYLLGIDNSIILEAVAGVLLIGSVLAAVHHAATIAHKLGEPFGTIILAVAITVIEVALIISLMVAG
ncbi:sodium-potassium/proton antiporter ChaA, partial [Escherichia coli]|nr:sodium-potassium/proton antiporter ChaA [Escherichia coli]